ncbi:hypothetical protein FRC04_006682 [Tulasnella sp. 424]|nr:hypothetical protein FRC04_006682 [Tulasnella sp. 424]
MDSFECIPTSRSLDSTGDDQMGGGRREAKTGTFTPGAISGVSWDQKDLPSRSDIQDWDGNVMEMIFNPKTLTDRAWKDLYPKLTPLLKLHKKRRLRREAQGRLEMKRNVVWQYFKEWMNEEPEATIHPSFFLEPRKLFAVPAIAKLIKSSDETTIREDLWIKNVAKVAAANRTNQEKIIAALRLVLDGRPHPQKMQSLLMGKDPFEDLQVLFDPSTEVSADDLFAPTAVFFCTKCKVVLWFPDLLIHECCLVTPWTPGASGGEEWLDKTFHTSKLQAASRICSFIPRLVGDLELSSGTTYSEAMDLGKVFLCLRCDELVSETMSFDKLVQHYVDECRWYQSMESHLSKNPAAPTPDSDDDDDELPVFIHTHGDQEDGRLACVTTEAQLERAMPSLVAPDFGPEPWAAEDVQSLPQIEQP